MARKASANRAPSPLHEMATAKAKLRESSQSSSAAKARRIGVATEQLAAASVPTVAQKKRASGPRGKVTQRTT